MLPLLTITGVLLRGHPVAPVLAAMLLVKSLTGLALLSMNAFVAASGEAVEPGEPIIWSVLTIAAAWLVLVGRHLRQPGGAWLRPSIW